MGKAKGNDNHKIVSFSNKKRYINVTLTVMLSFTCNKRKKQTFLRSATHTVWLCMTFK